MLAQTLTGLLNVSIGCIIIVAGEVKKGYVFVDVRMMEVIRGVVMFASLLTEAVSACLSLL